MVVKDTARTATRAAITKEGGVEVGAGAGVEAGAEAEAGNAISHPARAKAKEEERGREGKMYFGVLRGKAT